MKFTPKLQNVTTPVDLFGIAYGIDRLDGELLYDYICRLHDRLKMSSNKTPVGLAAMVSRKLGLLNFYPIEIDVKDQFAPIAIDMSSVYVNTDTLYDTTASYTVDDFVGYPLVINGLWFEIIANTSNSITVSSPSLERYVRSVTSPTYTVKAARKPFIKITRSRLLLYEYYVDNVTYNLDTEVSLDFEVTFNDVVSSVSASSVFSVQILPTARYDLDEVVSRCLIPQSSIATHVVMGNGTTYNKLGVTNVVANGVILSDTRAAINEVVSVSQLSSSGDYFVDYAGGELYTYDPVETYATIRCVYNVIPYRPSCSLVITDNLRDPEYQRLVFEQRPKQIYDDPQNAFTNGRPLDEFFEDHALIRGLNNIFWGK